MERLAFNSTWRWLRLVACCSLTLLLLGVGGSSHANSFASPHSRGAATLADDPDLCALLPSGEGLEVQPGYGENGRFQSCQVEDNRSGDKHTFFVFSIAKFKTVDDARADFKFYDYANMPPGYYGEKWVPTTAFGDPGFAFEMAAVPPSDPSNPSNTQVSAKLAFARGIYRVSGDAGWKGSGNYALNDAGEIHSFAVSVDGALNAAVGPLPPEATPTTTEVPIPGATATETPQAEVDLQVHHIEVVQVVQTQDNKIPLVAGKKTVVRVFLKASGAALGGVASNVRASLYIRR